MADHVRATEGQNSYTCGLDSSPKETQWVYHNHYYGTGPLWYDNIVKKLATNGNTASTGHNFQEEAFWKDKREEEVKRVMNFKMDMMLFTDVKLKS